MNKVKQVALRIDAIQAEKIKAAAQHLGMGHSTFIRMAAIKEAERVNMEKPGT